MEVIIAAIAKEQITAEIAIEKIVSPAAVQFIARQLGFGNDLARGDARPTGVQSNCRIGVKEIAPLATPKALADETASQFIARIAKKNIVAIVAIDLVEARITMENIVARAAANDIAARTAMDENIVA